MGFDVHPFGDAPPLVLGGVRIPDAPRLLGHSDGDAVAHAVADALLGPAGLPDLGTLFPATDESLRASLNEHLLSAAGQLATNLREGVTTHIAIVIAAEKPRLAPYMPEIAAKLTAVLEPAKEPMGRGIHVSVRPKRAEGLGAIGRAEGIAVWAVALLSRLTTCRISGTGARRSCSTRSVGT